MNDVNNPSESSAILPDSLVPNLSLVFCGTAAGRQSARVGSYYAGFGNSFWETLFRTNLTPRKISPREFPLLTEYGIGLTDLVKVQSGCDKDLSSSSFDIPGFCSKILANKPKIVAFNGKAAAMAFFGCSVNYGGPLFDPRVGETAIFVLPSTSAAARRYWDGKYWNRLATAARNLD